MSPAAAIEDAVRRSLLERRHVCSSERKAWELARQPSRTNEEEKRMLQLAMSAMDFWGHCGFANDRAHAHLLLAHVFATQRNPNRALMALVHAEQNLGARGAQLWERALLHAVAAGVAASQGDPEGHRANYLRATELVAALPDADERAILEATVRVLPVPVG